MVGKYIVARVDGFGLTPRIVIWYHAWREGNGIGGTTTAGVFTGRCCVVGQVYIAEVEIGESRSEVKVVWGFTVSVIDDGRISTERNNNTT